MAGTERGFEAWSRLGPEREGLQPNRGYYDCIYSAELSHILQLYAVRIAGWRLAGRQQEAPAAIEALLRERDAAIARLAERLKASRRGAVKSRDHGTLATATSKDTRLPSA